MKRAIERKMEMMGIERQCANTSSVKANANNNTTVIGGEMEKSEISETVNGGEQ